MIRKVTAITALVLLLLALSAGAAFAADGSTPTQTTDDCTIAHTAMSTDTMIGDIQTWTAGLPAGVRTKIMTIVRQLSPDKLMLVHHTLCHTDLLQKAPAQIVSAIVSLAR